MPAHENTTNNELLSTLAGIPFTDPAYGQWWASEEGRWLYDAIARRVGGPLISASDSLYGVSFDPEDVANTAVSLLRRPDIHPYITGASDPWGYLASVIRRQLRRDAGAYFRVPLDDEEIGGLSSREPDDDSGAPGLQESVERTVAYLNNFAPAAVREHLDEAVWYFAERGHNRLSHLFTDATKDPYLADLGLGRREILAVANAVLGSRPAHGHNSVLGGYLSSPAFDPDASIPHRLAMRKFTARLAGDAGADRLRSA